MVVLDMTAGSRMMWFDKADERAVFVDQRHEAHTLCDGRSLTISPDIQADFRALPFSNDQFSVVVFDPPHLIHAGENSWLAKKYGRLNPNWRDDIRKGFTEAFRVLKPDGVLIFKWNETQLKVKELLELTPHKPLFGHPTNRKGTTHWFTFLKAQQ
jgi:ubiquinone/menaquinone biosynthesis C-methylase UbiE